MQIKAFRVRKFRNIEDSGSIDLLGPLTCVVGKNQSGKSALLRALHKFNPHSSEPYDMRHEWPRGQRNKRDDDHVVCEVSLLLAAEEANELNAIGGRDAIAPLQAITVTRTYAGDYGFEISDIPELFRNPLEAKELSLLCDALPTATKSLGEDFLHIAKECANEMKHCIENAQIDDLTDLSASHQQKMEEYLREDRPASQRAKQEEFVATYLSQLDEIVTGLKDRLSQYERALEYIVDALPTFIYMDDYRTFRGRDNLENVRIRRDGASGDLSEEDDTFLMILKLAGLDLDQLIEQGESGEEETIHERQLDLQDAAKTLTRNVEGRWGQNEYEVVFRADGQTFFTEIEETKKKIGMIPLEEQSKGFQWFFSFDMHFMHDSEGTFEGCVLLLDEPGLHLHPGGQADLLRRLDAYAEKNILIYTTHLPFLVDLRDPKRIKVINQTDSGAVVSDDLGASQTDERLTLQAALGMRANQSYLVAKRNLLVEGVDDYWFISELSKILERAERICVPGDVLITAAGSASEIVPMATFMIGQNLDVVALFDSDNAGQSAEEKLLKRWITSYRDARARTLLVGDAMGLRFCRATIEDLFPEDYYLQRVIESHERKLSSRGLSGESIKLSGTGPVLPRLRQCFQKVGVDLNKGSAAKLIRTDLIRCTKIDDLPDGVQERAEALMEAIRSAFGGTDEETK